MKRIVCLIAFFLFVTHYALAQVLYIYGGKDHDVYLGKLNASEYDSESIWNVWKRI